MSNCGRKGNELAFEQSGPVGGEKKRRTKSGAPFSARDRNELEGKRMLRFLLAGCKDRRIAREGKRDRRHRNARKRELQQREDPASFYAFDSLPSTNNIDGVGRGTADKNRLLWHATRFTLPCLRSSKTEIARGKMYIIRV